MDEKKIAQQALEAHHQLDKQIDRLKLELNANYETSIPVWLANCTRHFRHFHNVLRAHMGIEESDGFMVPVQQHRPTLTRKVEELLQQHREMTASCEDIERSLRALSDPKRRDVTVIREKIDALLTALKKHEQAENKLVQEVFTQDIGEGG